MNPGKSAEKRVSSASHKGGSLSSQSPVFPCLWSYRLAFTFPNCNLFPGKTRERAPQLPLQTAVPEGQREVGTVVLVKCLDGPERCIDQLTVSAGY